MINLIYGNKCVVQRVVHCREQNAYALYKLKSHIQLDLQDKRYCALYHMLLAACLLFVINCLKCTIE